MAFVRDGAEWCNLQAESHGEGVQRGDVASWDTKVEGRGREEGGALRQAAGNACVRTIMCNV